MKKVLKKKTKEPTKPKSKEPTKPKEKKPPAPAPPAKKLKYRKGLSKQRRRVRRGARAIPRGFASKRTTTLANIQRTAQVGTGIRSVTQEQIFQHLNRRR